MIADTDTTSPPCEGGYVLIHRKLFKNPTFKSEFEAMAFAWLVTKASWRDVTVRYKERAITLHRGQLAVSVRDMATKLDRNRQWVDRFLARLTQAGMIETCNETGVNVVTIRNYDVYQRPWDSIGTPCETPPGQDRDTTGTQNNEGNKDKEGNKEKKDIARGTRLPTDWVLPDEWREFAKTEKGWTDHDVSAEANEFRDYWVALGGAKGVKTDWLATWRNWVRRSYRKPSASSYTTGKSFAQMRERITTLEYELEMWQFQPEDYRIANIEKKKARVAELEALKAAVGTKPEWRN